MQIGRTVVAVERRKAVLGMMTDFHTGYRKGFTFHRVVKAIRRDYMLMVMCIPGVVIIILFKYLPIYGITLAFKKYMPALGIMGSPWAGLRYFEEFLTDPYIWRIFRNTLLLNVYRIIWGFPAPILLALLLNEVRTERFKKTIQTITYLPYFVSTVIIISIMTDIFSLSNGIFNDFMESIGLERIYFFGEEKWFRTLYIGSGIWQSIGYSSIIYLAAIAGVNIELYEAAYMDGVNRLQKIWYITLPCIMPTIIILFILNMGGLLGSNLQKILLMYSPATYETSDVISTYVYRSGIEQGRISFSTAVGLLLSVLSFGLVLITNAVSRKVSETSLW